MLLGIRFWILCILVVSAVLVIGEAQDTVEWRRLAEQGDAEAQFKLGNRYVEGRGVPQDFAEAAKWYRMAAEQGHATAQNNLGVMYANGEGVPQDDVQAYAWFDIAAAQGDTLASEAKDVVAQRMTGEARVHAKRLARQYWETYVLPFRN